MSTPAPASVLAPKPHYAALDGLRGVAAVMVVLFHMFEGSARDFQFHTDQIINHGYLSVDFFFMLSGFVIGYAYDDRWEKMNLWNFCKRRLVRLRPVKFDASRNPRSCQSHQCRFHNLVVINK